MRVGYYSSTADDREKKKKAGRLNVSELARVCDLSRTTAYKYIGLLEKLTAGLLPPQ